MKILFKLAIILIIVFISFVIYIFINNGKSFLFEKKINEMVVNNVTDINVDKLRDQNEIEIFFEEINPGSSNSNRVFLDKDYDVLVINESWGSCVDCKKNTEVKKYKLDKVTKELFLSYLSRVEKFKETFSENYDGPYIYFIKQNKYIPIKKITDESENFKYNFSWLLWSLAANNYPYLKIDSISKRDISSFDYVICNKDGNLKYQYYLKGGGLFIYDGQSQNNDENKTKNFDTMSHELENSVFKQFSNLIIKIKDENKLKENSLNYFSNLDCFSDDKNITDGYEILLVKENQIVELDSSQKNTENYLNLSGLIKKQVFK